MRYEAGGSGSDSAPGRLFQYTEPNPWSWLPPDWVKPGTVFIGRDDRFYRLLRPQETGWWCEPVPDKTVGSETQIAELRRLRLDFELATSKATELAALPPPETSSFPSDRLNQLEEERRRLRYRLAELCNARGRVAREPGVDPELTRKWLVIAAAAGFASALVYAVCMMLGLPPEPRRAATLLLVICLALLVLFAALAVLVPALFGPDSPRGRELLGRLRISGNLVGCIGLLTLLLLAVVAFVIGTAIIRHYTGGLGFK